MPLKAYESPLVPHARMRALYRALAETRALSKRLGRARGGLMLRTEAPWASSALELRAGDLVSAPGGYTALAEHIRAVGARSGTGAPRSSATATTLAATPIPFSGSEADRMLCAAGGAMALRAAAAGGVVVAYLSPDSLPASAWTGLLRIVGEAALPLLLVVLPPVESLAKSLDLDRLAARASMPAVPVLPVDGRDPIALYRVAGEALGRARAGGGAAILHCQPGLGDPIQLLGSQLVTRGIATQAWLDSIEPSIATLLPRSASTKRKASSQRKATA